MLLIRSYYRRLTINIYMKFVLLFQSHFLHTQNSEIELLITYLKESNLLSLREIHILVIFIVSNIYLHLMKM